MEPQWSSDVELAELLRAGGESVNAALIELEARHFGAVRRFAALCVTDDSAAEHLAARAWRRALWPYGAGEAGAGALRPRALALVLQAAAEIADTCRPGTLDADLARWLSTGVGMGAALMAPDAGGLPSSDVTIFLSGSPVTRAFNALPANLQAVMWHHLVEQADSSWIGRLLGSDSPDSQEIPALTRRAYRDFYDAYVRIHREGLAGDCHGFHRMVMAYANHNVGNAADVIQHLQQCDYCSSAVVDLERMYVNFGELLVEALLPWGGHAYAASRRAPWISAPVAAPDEEPAELPRGVAAQAMAPDAGEHRSAIGRATGGVMGSVGLSERRTGASSVRTRRITLIAAFVGVCSLAVPFAYVQGFNSELLESTGEAPAGGSGKQPSDNRDRGTPGPLVRGAALEWLFDGVKGGATGDSSGANRDGTLVGDPLPKPLKEGGIAFFGQQSVASKDSVLDTDGSFSVSARVKLRNKDEYQTVASQDGAEVSSFQLQFDPVEDRWEMRMHREDTQTSPADEAESDGAPRAGRWTSLTGVFDAAKEEIRLYVDGKLQDTVHREPDRSSEGDFAVGRARLGDQFIREFEGTVDDVRAFPKALTGAQAKKLARGK